jgi:hypothetical protein
LRYPEQCCSTCHGQGKADDCTKSNKNFSFGVIYHILSRNKYWTTLGSHVIEDFPGTFFGFVGSVWVSEVCLQIREKVSKKLLIVTTIIHLVATDNVTSILIASLIFVISIIALAVSNAVVTRIFVGILKHFNHLAGVILGSFGSAWV